MTNAEIIQAFRAKIEMRIKECEATYPKDKGGYWFPEQEEAYAIAEEYKKLLSFLSTLEESEEPTLTWGDVQLLDTFILECAREEREGKDWGESEEFYTEVLRRYNDFVKRTIPEIVSKIHEYNENDRENQGRD